jgi:hypothetical protein
MHPYTIIQTPQSGVLTLVVPRELEGKRLVVTITEDAAQSAPPANPNAHILNTLLSAPTLDDEDLAGFVETRAHINRWRST